MPSTAELQRNPGEPVLSKPQAAAAPMAPTVPPARTLRILGTRGIPAAHGGFETFAEALALHLVERGWNVVVYCQHIGKAPIRFDSWRGIQRVHISAGADTSAATVRFDWQAIRHAARLPGLCLTLGYNTALFCVWLRLAGRRNVINMDGIEWKRAKWGPLTRLWFRMNERAGCLLADHLVADHPNIASHLARLVNASKTTMIPYGAERTTGLSAEPVVALGLEPRRYFTLIARPEPENSVLEVVRGWSRRRRGMVLAVLGGYQPDNAYHCEVRASASSEVRFLGPIYDKHIVRALRLHGAGYVHGHQVGGTNPSLVEALGAGNAVIAHDNDFNRWVAQDGATYFIGTDGFERALEDLLADPLEVARLQVCAVNRFEQAFRWDLILNAYEALLLRFAPAPVRA